MANFCLIKSEADKLKQAILKGDINPDKLSSLSSKETAEYLAKFLSPENAKQVNILYEKKLLLKNQDRAIFNLFKDITGLSEADKLKKVASIKADLARKNARLFNPQEGDKVLQSLIDDTLSRRYKVGISKEEADKIIELTNTIEKNKNFTNTAERVKYGRSKIALVDYVNQLSGKKASLGKNVLGLPRAVMATLDLSAPLNQGWGMLSRKEFYKNLGTMLKSAKNEKYFIDTQAEILTRDTYKGMKKAGLRISDLGDKLENREEVFMTTLLDKIPGIKGSQRAYTGFLNKLRADVYDNLYKQALNAGEDVSVGSKVLEDIAKSVNIFTGGYGKTDPILNGALFSPRKIQSSLQILNPMTYIDPKTSKTVRMANLRNILGSLGITGTMIGLANLLGGDDVDIETDPTSSDYGKIKVGDARVDVSGGNAGYIILASRIKTGKKKSSTTGVKRDLNGGFGQDDSFTLGGKFIRNKLSPIASLFVDIATGKDALGNKVTPTQAVINRFKPMFINNLYELYASDTKYKPIIASLALLGANVSIYDIAEKWDNKETVEMKQFKEKVGDKSFKEANDKYNQKIKTNVNEFRKSADYKEMTNEARAKQIEWIKKEAKKDVFKEYDFKKTSLPKSK